MPSEFRLPALGADMDAGTILEWHVAPGARVKRGDVVAVVETDKGAIDVEIFEDGIVREIVVPPGEKVAVGTVLALIETAEEDAAAAPPATGGAEVPAETHGAAATAPAPLAVPPAARSEPLGAAAAAGTGTRARATPAARRRAGELGVALDALRGTGPDGAITLEDVEAAAGAKAADAKAATPDARDSMRAAIAAAMSRSKREIPHYYLSTAVDVTPATEWLAAHNATAPVTERLLFAALLLKALALTCRETRGFSGYYRDGRYEESPAVHVGVAVALRGGGLVAPAIMDTADRPLPALMADFRELVARARAGRLRASELAAPTIILTSLGEDSVDAVFPIIQPPQVAIVGAGAVVARPWVVDGSVVPRQVITLSLGADHRVTDGRLGAQFLAALARRVCTPGTL